MNISSSSENLWMQLPTGIGAETIRFRFGSTLVVPGKPPSSTLIFTTSLRLPIPTKILFDFLRHEYSRNKVCTKLLYMVGLYIWSFNCLFIFFIIFIWRDMAVGFAFKWTIDQRTCLYHKWRKTRKSCFCYASKCKVNDHKFLVKLAKYPMNFIYFIIFAFEICHLTLELSLFVIFALKVTFSPLNLYFFCHFHPRNFIFF